MRGNPARTLAAETAGAGEGPAPLTRLRAQLTALAMEEQLLLEDIAAGNHARGERLETIEQGEVRIRCLIAV
ncbi:hypothetical protein ACLH17_28865 [Klebsiella pasteurii]|uniref:Uncharacterized protein n=1 Tax=Klebsiella pasteurii TaxID=2587529 RepID=A0ABT5CMG5_9ENTR|nr:hypothetical protein [Klebsiella pasteurii]MBG2719061.1 hypothetical protein [Klebsiella michiganensis]MDC0692733.1 hypothetical protein [Klebsiella pasteurii]MDC0754122.1 hypothetical protein [Klebsiella pasteurii]MDQ2168058.1 hypothetical protein [Klebsiella pasteurii]MDQ2200286.1 hypothetical protein [Klebsiella pasteurii]